MENNKKNTANGTVEGGKTASITKKVVKKAEIPNIDDILDNLKNESKSALTFNQDKSVAEKLKAKADDREKKVGVILNEILKGLVDLEKKECIIDIKEKCEDKEQNSFKIDTEVLDIFKAEAKSRNMSLNDYLNKVLKIVLK